MQWWSALCGKEKEKKIRKEKEKKKSYAWRASSLVPAVNTGRY